MKLMITIGHTHLILPAENTSPVIQAFESGQLYDTKGWGDSMEYVPNDSKIEFAFVRDEQLGERPEPLKKLQEQKEAADASWLNEYNKRTKLEKEVAELKAKLEAVTSAASA